MTAEQVPEPTPPWVRGYTKTVLDALDDGLHGVTRMRDHMGEGWNPIPSYEFHIALAKSRLRAIQPPVPGGDAAPSTHSSVSTDLPEQRGATP